MRIQIEMIGGDGRRWSFDKREVTLGRDAECDVRLASDQYLMVSRRHATVRTTIDGETWLEDQASFNGTLLNGRRVQRERVTSGDIIRLGDDGPEM